MLSQYTEVIMLDLLTRNLKRVVYAISGIIYALGNDDSYRWQFFGGLVFITFFMLMFQPLNQTEYLFLGLGWVLILITELQNSSFEAALDRLHPEEHDEIGRSKDMAAGAVLTAGFFLVFVIAMIILL